MSLKVKLILGFPQVILFFEAYNPKEFHQMLWETSHRRLMEMTVLE